MIECRALKFFVLFFKDMPHTLWYLAVMLDKKRDRLLQFIRNESTRFDEGTVSSLLGRCKLIKFC